MTDIKNISKWYCNHSAENIFTNYIFRCPSKSAFSLRILKKRWKSNRGPLSGARYFDMWWWKCIHKRLCPSSKRANKNRVPAKKQIFFAGRGAADVVCAVFGADKYPPTFVLLRRGSGPRGRGWRDRATANDRYSVPCKSRRLDQNNGQTFVCPLFWYVMTEIKRDRGNKTSVP